MAAINENEQRDLEVIQQLKHRRLGELEKQAAILGRSTPAEIRMEITDLKKELGVVNPIIRGELSEEMLSALRNFGIPAAMANAIQNFEARLYDLRSDVRDLRRFMYVFMLALLIVALLALR